MLDLALGIASKQTTMPPGGLVVSAQNPGTLWPNYAATWYVVLRGDPTSTADNIRPAIDCPKAVKLLNKSTIDSAAKKMSSDPLFNMTAQLVGAQLNRFMGSGISGVTIVNIDYGGRHEPGELPGDAARQLQQRQDGQRSRNASTRSRNSALP